MDRGYVAIWRKIQDHVFYKEKREYSKLEAWVDILMEAQHCENEKDVVIKMKLFKCGYGESLKSIRTWGARWGWGEAKVKRFFDLLVKMNQIRYKNETVTTRITILNYSSYDPKRNSYETRPKHHRNTTETRPKTDKNVKKEKNGKNDILSDSHESDKKEKIYDEIIYFVTGFQNAVLETHGAKAPKITESLIKNGSSCIEKLIRLDGFEKEEVFNAIRWAYKDSFWSNQVFSMASLRTKGKNGLTKFQNIINAKETKPATGYRDNEPTPFYHKSEAPAGYK